MGFFEQSVFHSNLMPCAKGSSFEWLMVMVERRMYCFQASLPDSRPPPVSFSPPKAPPISAPDVGMFTFTKPQSDPFGPIHCAPKKDQLCVNNLMFRITLSSRSVRY